MDGQLVFVPAFRIGGQRRANVAEKLFSSVGERVRLCAREDKTFRRGGMTSARPMCSTLRRDGSRGFSVLCD